MRRMKNVVPGLAALALLAGCGGPGTETMPAAPYLEARRDGAQEGVPQTGLDRQFARAAAEHRVPVSLLKAISFAETRFQMVAGEVEFDGMPAAYGLMALRGERLARGAALAGVTVEQAQKDPLANLQAAAALLSAYADELGLDRKDLGAWAPAVARASGIEDPDGQAHYIHNDVYRVIRQGVVVEDARGPVASIMPEPAQARFRPVEDEVTVQSADYPPAVWRASPNYNSRPTGSIGQIGMIIIHTCEGSYTSCWSWLTNSSSGVSAHYVVKEDGAEISQLVLEANRAWHVGATYDCSLNSNVDCWRNGYSVNHFSVGIEHGGFASQSSFPTSQIEASAKLACDISRDRAIPRDSYHIVAHGKLQPYNRTDPGPNWPWTDYLNRINNNCSAGTIIIDSNNNNNNTSVGYISVSANWTSSTNVAGYYGTGYFWASTQAVSDPATFWFYLSAPATRTIDAWWTAGTDRSTTAPWIISNASGTQLATVYTNQQINGGKWNTLGSWSFTAGWNKVQLSRWTTAGSVVIADAIQIR